MASLVEITREEKWNSRLEEEDGGVSTMLGLCGCLDVLLGK